MYDGGGEWKCDRRAYETASGGLSLWQPGDTHNVTRLYPDSRRAPVATQRVLLFDPEILEGAARELGMPRGMLRLKRRILDTPGSFRAFQRLHDALEGPSTPLERESRFAQCVRMLAEQAVEGAGRARETGPESQAVRRVREVLIDRHAETVRLDELAAIGGIGKFHLIRAFSREVGLPPHEFQLTVRVAKASRMLRRGWPAAQIAAALGFADQSHFIRTFRRWMHCTPGVFASR